MAAVMEKSLNMSSPDGILLAGLVTGGKKPFKRSVQTVDVVIIGAGVAGAYLAHCLGMAGIDAVILEQNGKRGCSDDVAVATGTLSAFPLITGIVPKVESSLEIVSRKGKILRFPASGDKSLNLFSRTKLVSNLLDKAKHLGIICYKEKVMSVNSERGNWIVCTDNRTLNCRFVIGADGWNSIVRKAVLGPFNMGDLLFGAGYQAQGDHSEGLQIRYLPEGEYLRMFNCGSTVSLGVFGSALNAKKTRYTLDGLIRNSLGTIRARMPWTAFIPCPNTPQFYSIPCSGRNWLLIGEAAGHVHPLSGQGVHYALWSASLASQALSCGEPRLFDSLWRDEYGRDLELGVLIKNKLHLWNRRVEWGFSASARSAVFRNLVADLFSSGINQKALCSRLLKEIPLSVLEITGSKLLSRN